jgi:hypothetical protein
MQLLFALASFVLASPTGSPTAEKHQVALLKNGATVEILAITDEGRQLSWSTKDGSQLSTWYPSRPYGPASQSSDKTKRLILRVSGESTLHGPYVEVDITPKTLEPTSAGMSHETPVVRGCTQWIAYCSLRDADPLTKATVKVTVATTDWDDKLSASYSNGVLTGSKGNFKPVMTEELPRPQPPTPPATEKAVRFRFDMPSGLRKHSFQFVAYDKNGREMRSMGGGWRSDLKGQGEIWVRGKAADVARFVLQTRAMETVTFTNVVVSPKQ